MNLTTGGLSASGTRNYSKYESYGRNGYSATINGDYGAALHAFTINPLVPGGVMAKTLLDELLIAHKAHLPNFADAINKIEETQPETVTYVAELMKSN